MNLFNKKLLAQHTARYDYPRGLELEEIQTILQGWQKALRDSNLDRTKETGIQGQFLSKFFETVLGYDTQTSGKELWNLNQEPKTEVDAQEADGSLGFFTKDVSKTLAVIELKDAKTSLDKKQSGRIGKLTPVEQAFQYLNKFDGCKWAIVSNFREIRLYSKSRGQGFYEKFDIINLTEEHEFKRFFFILNKHNLIDDGQKSVIDHLVEDTTVQEENITKKFYEHYKEIRLKVLNHLFEHNPEIDRLVLVEKTQKLLDRLIFTMVCEDSSTLLPAHLVKNTYDRAFQSFALSDSDQRVWTEFKGLFHAIDKGNKRVIPPINAYNGGLFKADEILDCLIVKDEIWLEIIKLTQYDFESDLNVNVLGHIFEQSISDLEEIRESVSLVLENGSYLLAEDGQKISLGENSALKEKKGARKKMGIFYTPEYITKYIVENTVGKYLEENPDKLATIKILDPACGSGAFLNQAHSFLLTQYKIRDEEKQLELQKQGKATGLFDLKWVENDKSILLNNLFGVDLSPESVEITKLALWLKTAKATEPLQNLDNNIKCGNSLIDDSVIAGKRAFNWNIEYQNVMANGGFDVIIGNPPYGAQISKDQRNYYLSKFNTANYKLDTYALFVELGISLLRDNGFLAFIVPYTWLTINQHKKLREMVLESGSLIEIVDIKEKVFDDADLDTVMMIFQKKGKSKEFSVSSLASGEFIHKYNHSLDLADFSDYNRSPEAIKLRNKMKMNSPVSNYGFEVSQGYIPYRRSDLIIKYGETKGNSIIDNREWHSEIESVEFKKELQGKDVCRYYLSNSTLFVKYGRHVAGYVDNKFFINPRLLVREITRTGISATYSEEEAYNTPVAINIIEKNNDKLKLKSLLAYLNSKLFFFYHVNNHSKALAKTSIPKILVEEVRNVQINAAILQDKELPQLVDQQLSLHEKLSKESSRLIEVLNIKLSIQPNTALNNFYQLGWNEFIAELEKQKIELDVAEQDKLNKWFNKVRKSLLDLEREIKDIDQKIDAIIYNLYDLNNEEILLIENTWKKL